MADVDFEVASIVAQFEEARRRQNEPKKSPSERLWQYAERKSEGRWRAFRWLKWVCERIEPLLAAGNARILIEAPPQFGKSELISMWLPAWILENDPTRRVILASYSDDLANSKGGRVREALGIKGPAHNWKTAAGGGMLSTTFSGQASGFSAEDEIFDDPTKNMEEALSPGYQERLRSQYKNVFLPRVQANGNILCIMTRWTETDFGSFLREKGFTVFSLPAIAEDGDAMGRAPGEPLCPERGFTVDFLKVREMEVGPIGWAGLYQQRPAPLEGNIFKRDWWQYYAKLPDEMERWLFSWDMNFKETTAGSFVCGGLWAVKGANFYLVDVVRARLEFVAAKQLVVSFSVKHQARGAFEKLIEDKANGPAIVSELRNTIGGFIEWHAQGKMVQAIAASPYVAAGNVFLPDPAHHPDASWVSDYVEELAKFPGARNDDQVDMTSQAILHLTSTRALTCPQIDETIIDSLAQQNAWGDTESGWQD